MKIISNVIINGSGKRDDKKSRDRSNEMNMEKKDRNENRI